MKTELKKLKEQYPDLRYDTGCFFENTQDWVDDAPLTVTPESHVVINADAIIEDHYCGRDILTNPNEKNPENFEYEMGTGIEYIQQNYKSHAEAFKAVKP